jgi:hydrogenase maturation factor
VSCGADHCITCSDEAVPMRVLELSAPGLALCQDESGSASEVMTDLVGQVGPGDTLLVHAGTALLLAETRSV